MTTRLSEFKKRQERKDRLHRASVLRKRIERDEQELYELEEALKMGDFSRRPRLAPNPRIKLEDVLPLLELSPKERTAPIRRMAMHLGICRGSVYRQLSKHLVWQQRKRPDVSSEPMGGRDHAVGIFPG